MRGRHAEKKPDHRPLGLLSGAQTADTLPSIAGPPRDAEAWVRGATGWREPGDLFCR